MTRPTRITRSSATLINNILLSMNLVGKHTCNVLIDNMSDHLPSILLLHGITSNKKQPINITSRDLRKQNLEALKLSLNCVDFERMLYLMM